MTDDQKAPVQPASVVGLIGRQQVEAAVAGMRPGEFVPVGRAKMERMARMMALAYKIADESAVSLLECSCLTFSPRRAGMTFYKPWLDSSSVAETDAPAVWEAIEYLELRGMLEHHPSSYYLVRIIEQGGD